ncbi:uncharacterized protein J3R85_020470 [Psidium guajava]|nr:uncharacterized protein J3R85_020470 [Psidium guajava]
MAMGNHLRLYASSRPWKIFKLLPPSMAYLCHTKKYTQHRDSDERAPSTAEEFRRVAEEKLKSKEAEEKSKEAEQGLANRVIDKTDDGTEEAVRRDGNLESVKKRHEQHEENFDYRRRG